MTNTKAQLKDLQNLFSGILQKTQIKLVITTERKVTFLDEFNSDKEHSLAVGYLDIISTVKILKNLAEKKEANLNSLFPIFNLEEISAHQLFQSNHTITPAYITEIVNLIKLQKRDKTIMEKMCLFKTGIERQMNTDYWSNTNKIIHNGFEQLVQKINKENIFYRLQNFILFACFFRYG